MNISITGVGRIVSNTETTVAVPSEAGTVRESVAAAPVDEVTNQPLPPRFPWLSRLAAELEPVAKQKPAFPSAPALGDHVNQAG